VETDLFLRPWDQSERDLTFHWTKKNPWKPRSDRRRAFFRRGDANDNPDVKLMPAADRLAKAPTLAGTGNSQSGLVVRA